MSGLRRELLKTKLPPGLPQMLKNPGAAVTRGGRKLTLGRKKDYHPVSWSSHFDKYQTIQTEGGQFGVYSKGETGPVLCLLHGGGFSALSWALFATCATDLIECRILAIDLRGHGRTKTNNDTDLSIDTLSKDVGDVLESMYPNEMPDIVLMGHSMGGAVAVNVAANNLVPSLIALVVIDVVEGTALEALSSMQSLLKSRPKSFDSVQTAIEWCVRSGQIKNSESARISVPGQIVNSDSGELASDIVPDIHEDDADSSKNSESVFNRLQTADSIREEDETNEAQIERQEQPTEEEQTKQVKESQFRWRIDLAETEPYWNGWFKGLSDRFLSCSQPKLLLLAGVDRLDRVLTVGQMQGKFQMQVLPQSGHAVHEDVPDKVADVIATFLVRHKFANATLKFTRVVPAC